MKKDNCPECGSKNVFDDSDGHIHGCWCEECGADWDIIKMKNVTKNAFKV